MKILQNVKLAPYTSFGVGGPAEYFTIAENHDALIEALRCTLPDTPLNILSYGSNTLISDKGLVGMTICIRGGDIHVDDNLVTADAGVWWDDVVQAAIARNLWGIELMSEIPGGVGGSTFINIAAYGQSLGAVVEWIEVWDRQKSEITILQRDQLQWDYKSSLFQTEAGKDLVIIRIALRLSYTPTCQVTYQKAVDIAQELGLSDDTLASRRTIIIEARRRAGSLWNPTNESHHTVGSFFRNPIVSKELADRVIAFDESGKTKKEIEKMNKLHGGDSHRVSAAHVMLAAGFHRGQKWKNVKLNDENLLKIEALEGATAEEIYAVANEIITTCNSKLGINLIPEAKILGEFS